MSFVCVHGIVCFVRIECFMCKEILQSTNLLNLCSFCGVAKSALNLFLTVTLKLQFYILRSSLDDIQHEL